MSGLDANALDRYITGGRYRKEFLRFECPDCEEWTGVTYEEEYGAGELSPAECNCGHEFTFSDRNEVDEPDGPDRWEDLEP